MQAKLLYLGLAISATVCSADPRFEARDTDSLEDALYQRETDELERAVYERDSLPTLRRRQYELLYKQCGSEGKDDGKCQDYFTAPFKDSSPSQAPINAIWCATKIIKKFAGTRGAPGTPGILFVHDVPTEHWLEFSDDWDKARVKDGNPYSVKRRESGTVYFAIWSAGVIPTKTNIFGLLDFVTNWAEVLTKKKVTPSLEKEAIHLPASPSPE